jgi:hypothetical protein
VASDPVDLLHAAYIELGYADGDLLRAVSHPVPGSRERERWTDVGDWLALASRMGAEQVLFVRNEPVIVFRSIPDPSDEMALLHAYREAWCMAGPQCLFLAVPGELRVYALTQPPARNLEEWKSITPLGVVERAGDIAQELARVRREEIESGRLFERDAHFGNTDNRADERLIYDLVLVRRALIAAGLDRAYAHALIGRSIFIRYLEDRGVLTADYFSEIAAGHPQWEACLADSLEKPDVGPTGGHRRYYRVLMDKAFTYALFHRLSEHFNGDMFPQIEAEHHAVKARHLELLRRFLLGELEVEQHTLFFWAYDFRIVPIALVSSIYEEFYHSSREDDKGTHYTPPALVDYVLSQVLTENRLATKPRILDPACGSGIFLVEAFRRVVRYAARSLGRPLSAAELRTILREQIAGIEVNLEATRVAAFSLYLALLHYQDPPEILAALPLPRLLYSGRSDSSLDYNILVHANAFALVQEERLHLETLVQQRQRFPGRSAIIKQLTIPTALPFTLRSFDIVVGNPPWEETGKPRSDTNDIENPLLPDAWARLHQAPIGDRSYSQLFIVRGLSFVAPGGAVGLLVHSSVLFNQRDTSQAFRNYWLKQVRLLEVTNFAHTRRVFFNRASAPFAFVHFTPAAPEPRDTQFVFNSARATDAAHRLRSVAYVDLEPRIVDQREVAERSYLWKVYSWGSHHDAALMARLDMEPTLGQLVSGQRIPPGYGWQTPGGGTYRQRATGLLAKAPVLGTVAGGVLPFGPLRSEWFGPPPQEVGESPHPGLFQGQRLVVSRGVQAGFGPCARLESTAFSFRHLWFCVPLHGIPKHQAHTIAAIFWSSLGRYRLFMKSATWGIWYDAAYRSDILAMPIRVPSPHSALAHRLSSLVETIRTLGGVRNDLAGRALRERSPELEAALSALNQAVFDLFELTPAERDLVEDFHASSLSFAELGTQSPALRPTAVDGLPPSGAQSDLLPAAASGSMAGYLGAFLEVWNRDLAPAVELRWRLFRSRRASVVAIVFTVQPVGAQPPVGTPDEDWNQAMSRVAGAVRRQVSQHIYIDNVVRAVTDTDIIIVKRDHQRLWSRSVAREDAEATLLQAIQLSKATLSA